MEKRQQVAFNSRRLHDGRDLWAVGLEISRTTYVMLGLTTGREKRGREKEKRKRGTEGEGRGHGGYMKRKKEDDDTVCTPVLNEGWRWVVGERRK
jgi:hypothetical protein